MSEKISHGTVVVERVFKATPERTFAAWSSRESLLGWSVPGDGSWELSLERFDFRVGGGETSEFGPKTGERYRNETLYLDIVENERIVSAGSMATGGRRIFAGLMTAEFRPEGTDGCRLKMTEQGAYFGVEPKDADHEAGWNEMFKKLERFLTGRGAPVKNRV